MLQREPAGGVHFDTECIADVASREAEKQLLHDLGRAPLPVAELPSGGGVSHTEHAAMSNCEVRAGIDGRRLQPLPEHHK